ncbi:DNA/RNA nuclease SfsA [bacterium]|nr:DNA/RNA nuclease SfsA [bacterium]
MLYTAAIVSGTLVKRYKRFLADVEVDGERLTVHCPNSGSMAGLLDEGNPVRISGPHGGKRKLLYTLEQIRITRPDGTALWVGVNTGVPNKIVRELSEAGELPGFEGCTSVRSEVKLGEHSRIDLKLEFEDGPDAWVEVKNCTMVQEDVSDKASVNVGSIATFPDAVTSRGLKHLDELIGRVQAGERAAVVFTVQRNDADRFTPAVAYDPAYTKRFYEAMEIGVRMIPLPADVREDGVCLGNQPLPVIV